MSDKSELMATGAMEILASDLRMVLGAFEFLETALQELDGARQVELILANEYGDVFRIGYGGAGEPALLGITPAENGSYPPRGDAE